MTDFGHHECPSWMQTTVLGPEGTRIYCHQCGAYADRCGCK